MKLPEGALETAVAAAESAGRLQLEYARKGFSVSNKSSLVDMVTEADKKSEALITKALLSRFPGHGVLGEEGASREEGSPWKWIIDPLDGTTNFVHGHPVYCVSIALAFRGEPVLGAVHIPRLGDTYTAAAGRGAFKNGSPIRIAGRTALGETLMATGVPYDRATSGSNNLSYINALTPKVRGLRRLGAAAYDLCLVAEGVYDAYFELKIRPWDIAAGVVIVREAGGTARWWRRSGQDEPGELLDCVASSPAILPELVKALSAGGADYAAAENETPALL